MGEAAWAVSQKTTTDFKNRTKVYRSYLNQETIIMPIEQKRSQSDKSPKKEVKEKVSIPASPPITVKKASKHESHVVSPFIKYLSLLVVVTAIGWGKIKTHVAPVVIEKMDHFLGTGVPNKYITDIVSVQPQHFLEVDKCKDSTTVTALYDGKLFNVTKPMRSKENMPSDQVFFMLNGRNQGIYISWNGKFECIHQAAVVAAQRLGADMDWVENGVRLYSQMGFPVRSASELQASRNIAHILLDFQIWVWPGIEMGHKYILENGVTLTTIGFNPKIFDVQYFFNADEAAKIKEYGMPGLDRSKVDGEKNSSVVSSSRTSHTAFLPDSAFTRDFRRRSSKVARLPSASYSERLQLVRYEHGEFYRQHLDTFHSRDFLPKTWHVYSFEDYKTWVKWASKKLNEIDVDKISKEFRPGQPLHPLADDDLLFPNALLNLFFQDATAKNFFKAHNDEEWGAWIRENVDKSASKLMEVLLKDDSRPSYLPLIIKAWEEKLQLGELRYTFPKTKEINGLTHYFRWIRWVKERVSFHGENVPETIRPYGELYPKFDVDFQNTILEIILEDVSENMIKRVASNEWYDWILKNRGRDNVLLQVLQTFSNFAELAIKTWEARVGSPVVKYKMPKYIQHFNPQRFVTLFLYLNDVEEGGETVFPHSVDYKGSEINREGMSECSQGFAVPPRGLHASLFYVQTPENVPDVMSRHGGCPPAKGIKWGSNSFMWDSDADEGAIAWTRK
jgi:hypothetical protein